ncbi:MAG: hypothetical protein GY869_29815, partial [Planctomycetes bacterium]|nr:hypothetical protein [Planctomycetota bacterium]
PNYIKNLERLPDADQQRLLYGNWDYDNDPSQLIDFVKIQELWTNDFKELSAGERFITADIAMQGSDKYVLLVWQGWQIMAISVFPKIAAQEIEAHIRSAASTWTVPRSNIVFDSDGLGEYLNSYLAGAVAFHNGARALERASGPDMIPENYPNLKTQCYYELVKRINGNGIHIVPDAYQDEMIQELRWVKRHKMDTDGKLFILPKERIKAGLGRSPDFADALAMRMYFELSRERSTEITGIGCGDGIPGDPNRYMTAPDYTETTRTDINGNYSFTNLIPGDYTIRTTPATVPGGMSANPT